MKDKILSLAPNEEVQIIGHKCKSLLKVRNKEQELHVEETDPISDKATMEVTTFNFSDLKQYVIFEDYYQLIMNEGRLPSEIEDCINKLMNYHEDKIYGKSGGNLNAKDYDYQCISYY